MGARGTSRSRGERRARLAWAAAVFLWVAFAAPTLLRNRDESVGYALGAFFATLLIGIVLALAIRWLYVRLVARGDSLWSPGLFLLAAVIALLPTLNNVPDVADSPPNQAGREKLEDATDVLADLPPELDYAPPGPAQRQVATTYRAQFGNEAEKIEVRQIRGDDGARGLVVAARLDGVGDLEEAGRGFTAAGGQATRDEIAGTEFLLGRDSSGTHVAIRGEGDTLVLIFAATEADVRAFATPFANE